MEALEIATGQFVTQTNTHACSHAPYSWRQFSFVFRAGWTDLLRADGTRVLLAVKGRVYDVTGFVD